MSKALWWTLGSIAVVGGAAAIIVVKNKKKKESESKETESSTKKISNGVLYTGITSAQTKTLQAKLNDFIGSGALGQVAELFGIGAVTAWEYVFTQEKSGNVSYAFRSVTDGKASAWSEWKDYGWGITCSNACSRAKKAWDAAGNPEGVIYDGNGEASVENPAASTSKDVVSNTTQAATGSALDVFKTSIQKSLTNGALKVDGAYGKNTMAVVSALQIYLNATKKSGLTVDGKYGPKTDAATGWGICA